MLRMYGTDKKGNRQFLSEDRLNSVPVGEIVNISIGQNFDVTIRSKQTDFKRHVMGRNTFEAAYDIWVQNGGVLDEVVEVDENLSGDWAIIDKSAAHKRDGNQAQWRVQWACFGKSSGPRKTIGASPPPPLNLIRPLETVLLSG